MGSGYQGVGPEGPRGSRGGPRGSQGSGGRPAGSQGVKGWAYRVPGRFYGYFCNLEGIYSYIQEILMIYAYILGCPTLHLFFN